MNKFILMMTFFFYPPCWAQGDGHRGGGEVTEQYLQSIVFQIADYFETELALRDFEEIREFNQKNSESFSTIARKTKPILVRSEIRDDFNHVRTCFSAQSQELGRYFKCNSEALPPRALYSEPDFYKMVFHELLVQVGLEVARKEVPSEYRISARIEQRLHLWSGVKYLLIIPQMISGMPNPLTLDLERVVGIQDEKTLKLITAAVKAFTDLMDYELVSVGHSLTPVLQHRDFAYHVQFVTKTKALFDDQPMTMACYGLIRKDFDPAGFVANCNWTEQITRHAKNLVSVVSPLQRILQSELKGDVLVVGGREMIYEGQSGQFFVVPGKRGPAVEKTLQSFGSDAHSEALLNCMRKQIRELETFNNHGDEHYFKILHIRSMHVYVDADVLRREAWRYLPIDLSVSGSVSWRFDSHELSFSSALLLGVDLVLLASDPNSCQIIQREKIKEKLRSRGRPVISPRSRVELKPIQRDAGVVSRQD